MRPVLIEVAGVLTNLGPRRTEFIQNMLGYVDDYEQKVEELEAFLHAARREGLVDQKPDGSWALLEV
jgi:anaphase-promoting complex subunit 2